MTTERSSSEFYGPGTPCSQCGQELAANAPEWTEYCSVHRAKRAEPFESELRELIEGWRKQRTGHRDVDNAVEACADQLEALLDDET